MKENVLKTRITPHFSLEIDAEDGTPPKVWKLCYTYKAIAKIEETIGLDIKDIAAWEKISSGKHFPVIVWGGLDKFNPDVLLDEVIEVLNPEAQRILKDEVFALMFPGAREAYEKSLKAQESGASQAPNVQTAETTL
jgi:hypothetical protein